MQWLLTLETNEDMISICRVMNIFRRKGLMIATLAMTDGPSGFSMMAVVESPEAEADHIFNYLRRTEGIQNVTYYRHESFPNASFVFIDSEADNSRVAQVLKAFPESKLIFASHGKYLLEVPEEKRQEPLSARFRNPAFRPFACVKTTRVPVRRDLAAASA
jgi:acetolactate synthase regulatory subunit